MARKSIQELRAQAEATIESNVAGAVSAEDVRNMVLDFLEAIAPGYGYLTISGAKPQTVNIAASLLTFTGAQDSNTAETTSNFALGTIARLERGTSQLNFNCDIEAPANRFVTFTLYKNGAATSWKVTANGAGAGNPVACSMVAFDYADPAATYSIMVAAEVDNVVVSFSNTVLLLAVLPVNSYT